MSQSVSVVQFDEEKVNKFWDECISSHFSINTTQLVNELTDIIRDVQSGEYNDDWESAISEIDMAKVEADVTSRALPPSRKNNFKINLGSLLSKTEELSNSLHGEPEIHGEGNPFLIEDEGYLATQALEFYLEAAYNDVKMRRFAPEFKPF